MGLNMGLLVSQPRGRCPEGHWLGLFLGSLVSHRLRRCVSRREGSSWVRTGPGWGDRTPAFCPAALQTAAPIWPLPSG